MKTRTLNRAVRRMRQKKLLNLPRAPLAPPTKVRADKRRPARRTAKQLEQENEENA